MHPQKQLFPVNAKQEQFLLPMPNNLGLPSLHQNSDLQQEATTQSKTRKIKAKTEDENCYKPLGKPHLK